MNDQTYCLEYSASQDAVHVAQLPEILEKNYYNAVQGKSNDYQILYIGTHDDCSTAATLFLKIRTDAPVKRLVSSEY